MCHTNVAVIISINISIILVLYKYIISIIIITKPMKMITKNTKSQMTQSLAIQQVQTKDKPS